jgi:hypothetical protein
MTILIYRFKLKTIINGIANDSILESLAIFFEQITHLFFLIFVIKNRLKNSPINWYRRLLDKKLFNLRNVFTILRNLYTFVKHKSDICTIKLIIKYSK